MVGGVTPVAAHDVDLSSTEVVTTADVVVASVVVDIVVASVVVNIVVASVLVDIVVASVPVDIVVASVPVDVVVANVLVDKVVASVLVDIVVASVLVDIAVASVLVDIVVANVLVDTVVVVTAMIIVDMVAVTFAVILHMLHVNTSSCCSNNLPKLAPLQPHLGLQTALCNSVLLPCHGSRTMHEFFLHIFLSGDHVCTNACPDVLPPHKRSLSRPVSVSH